MPQRKVLDALFILASYVARMTEQDDDTGARLGDAIASSAREERAEDAVAVDRDAARAERIAEMLSETDRRSP